jgi:hypothetical protein
MDLPVGKTLNLKLQTSLKEKAIHCSILKSELSRGAALLIFREFLVLLSIV